MTTLITLALTKKLKYLIKNPVNFDREFDFWHKTFIPTFLTVDSRFKNVKYLHIVLFIYSFTLSALTELMNLWQCANGLHLLLCFRDVDLKWRRLILPTLKERDLPFFVCPLVISHLPYTATRVFFHSYTVFPSWAAGNFPPPFSFRVISCLSQGNAFLILSYA